VDETTRKGRELDALENIVKELERLRVLKEHELGVQLEYAPEGSGPYVPNPDVPTEQHTVEVSFEAEKVTELSDEKGKKQVLYRTPEDTYLVYMDTRHVREDVARIVGRDAVLDDGHAGLGHSESFARYYWPELFTSQARQ
jgi:hypothetical protein